MSWGRIGAALGLSIGLHAAAVGLLRSRVSSTNPTAERAHPSEVALTVLGGGASPRAPELGGTPLERRSFNPTRARGGRVAPPTTVEIATEPGGDVALGEGESLAVVELGGRGEGLLPGSNGGQRGAGGGEDSEGPGLGGGGAAPAIDLSPFVARLQESANRCGAVARRGRNPHRGQGPVGMVRFCVDPDGSPTAVSLVDSTGDPALDRAAMDCVVPGAAPLPRVDRCLVVPLRFH